MSDLAERILKGNVTALVLITLGATCVGFWLSYGGLHAFAVIGGLRGPEAWAWPASVDLFTLAGELGVTVSAITGKQDVPSWVLLVAGFMPSVAFNVLHVHPSNGWWPHYAVAAVPPVAAMLALAAMLRQVYRLAKPAAPASGDTVSSLAVSDAETAAVASLRATLAAGNPWSQNQLMARFGLTRAVAAKVRTDVMPLAELNGDGHE